MNLYIPLIAYLTITRKEILRIVRIWLQTVVPPIITMSLYFFIFGNLVGSRIGDMDGYPYIEFIVPGLVMMSIITNSYSNVVSSFFGSKFQRSVEEILIAPVPPSVIILGYISGGIFRGLIIGALVILVSLFFNPVRIHSIAIVISISLLAAFLFSLAGFTNALFAKRFDDVTIIPTFVLTPLTYLGGVFYSIQLLESPWRELSLFNPIVYLVNAFRFGILGHSDVPIYQSFLLVIVFILALFSLNLYFMRIGYGIRQ